MSLSPGSSLGPYASVERDGRTYQSHRVVAKPLPPHVLDADRVHPVVCRTLVDHEAFTLRAFCQAYGRSVTLDHQALAARWGSDVLRQDIRRQLKVPAVRAPAGAASGRVPSGASAGRQNLVYEHVDRSHSIRYTGRTHERAHRASQGGELNEITKAIAARQTQITQLQSEIATLQRAASIVGPPAKAAATAKPKQKPKAKPQPKPKPKVKPKATPNPKAKQKRHQWSAAEKAAIGKRMKAYWAKRRKARR